MPVLRVVVCVVLLCAARAAAGQEPAKFFDDNCAACHAIGGPPGAAPDLKDISKRRDHAWLVKFICDPEGLARTDATAAALLKQYDGVVMPATEGMTPAHVDALLRYIDGATAPPPSPPAAVRSATAADVAAGREWYEGRRSLSRRGPACVSCHRLDSIGGLGGGALGPDLTRAHSRLGGTAGTARWLSNPPTRVMRAVFRDHPLTGDEAFAVVALLADESARPAAAGARTPSRFAASGIAAALMATVSMAAVWSRRLRSVRRRMVAGARKDHS